jgi:hypothetical protein
MAAEERFRSNVLLSETEDWVEAGGWLTPSKDSTALRV